MIPFRTKATIVALLGAFLKAPFGFPLLTNARRICSESTFQVPLGAGNSLLCAPEEEEKDEIKLHGRMLPLDGKHSLISTQPFRKHSEDEPDAVFARSTPFSGKPCL